MPYITSERLLSQLINTKVMSQSMPGLPIKEEKSQNEPEDYSLPYPLVHKELNQAPFSINFKKLENTAAFIPPDDNSNSDITFSSAESSFSRSSYDPLENLSEYLKMRDQLWLSISICQKVVK